MGFSYCVLTQFQRTAKRKFFKETQAVNTMLIPSYQKKYKDKKKILTWINERDMNYHAASLKNSQD